MPSPEPVRIASPPLPESSRRRALGLIAGAVATAAAGGRRPARAAETRPVATASPGTQAPIMRAGPGGDPMAVIGMGTWITFNVGDDARAIASRTEVLRAFFELGGGLIDSSPMYGSSEAVVGRCLTALGHPRGLVAATKVWTSSVPEGRGQMADSERLWGVRRLDLQQVHNLVAWQEHLAWLAGEKAAGRVRAIGITTSHGRRHGDFEAIMREAPIDFVQLSYSLGNREAEARLLPMAAERGLGVIVNRPFQRGWLPRRLEGKPLPGWAAEIGCEHWAQVLLKLVVSHPAVTCAIPATSRVDHMRENMAAARGPLPDAGLRARMFRDTALLI